MPPASKNKTQYTFSSSEEEDITPPVRKVITRRLVSSSSDEEDIYPPESKPTGKFSRKPKGKFTKESKKVRNSSSDSSSEEYTPAKSTSSLKKNVPRSIVKRMVALRSSSEDESTIPRNSIGLDIPGFGGVKSGSNSEDENSSVPSETSRNSLNSNIPVYIPRKSDKSPVVKIKLPSEKITRKSTLLENKTMPAALSHIISDYDDFPGFEGSKDVVLETSDMGIIAVNYLSNSRIVLLYDKKNEYYLGLWNSVDGLQLSELKLSDEGSIPHTRFMVSKTTIKIIHDRILIINRSDPPEISLYAYDINNITYKISFYAFTSYNMDVQYTSTSILDNGCVIIRNSKKFLFWNYAILIDIDVTLPKYNGIDLLDTKYDIVPYSGNSFIFVYESHDQSVYFVDINQGLLNTLNAMAKSIYHYGERLCKITSIAVLLDKSILYCIEDKQSAEIVHFDPATDKTINTVTIATNKNMSTSSFVINMYPLHNNKFLINLHSHNLIIFDVKNMSFITIKVHSNYVKGIFSNGQILIQGPANRGPINTLLVLDPETGNKYNDVKIKGPFLGPADMDIVLPSDGVIIWVMREKFSQVQIWR